METPILQGLQDALSQHPLAYVDDLLLFFEAVDQDLRELATINQVLEVVLHRPEETRPEDHAQVVPVHLVLLLLRNHVIRQKHQHQHKHLLVDILHLCEDLPDEGQLITCVVADDLVVDLVVEERKLQVV